jgi:hypothetical protein
MLGGTGPGFATFFYTWILTPDVEHNGYLLGKINGQKSFYTDSGRQVIQNGLTIPIVYGEPTLLHLEFTASVGTGVRALTSFDLYGSLSLDPSYGIATYGSGTHQNILVEAPEPAYAGLIAGILMIGCLKFKKLTQRKSR